MGDKTLAEFVISLADGQSNAASYRECLAANGAEVPLDFCVTLLNIIKRLRPGNAVASGGGAAGGAGAAGCSGGEVPVKYPGLAVPDTRQRAAELSHELFGGSNPLHNTACVPVAGRLLCPQQEGGEEVEGRRRAALVGPRHSLPRGRRSTGMTLASWTRG